MLPKKHRIKKSTFPTFVGKGRSFFVEILTMRAVSDGSQAPARASVVVSKKVAKSAVQRNLIKRRVYAVLHTYMSTIKPGLSLVLYPKNTIIKTSFKTLKDQMQHLLTDSNVLLS